MSAAALREKTLQQYRGLMGNIRARFEIIDSLKLSESSEYAELETAAFHLRKSLEGVAFGCLVAMENGLKKVPREAIGQWNADRIFIKVKKHQPPVFPLAINREDPQEGDVLVQHHMTDNEVDHLSIDEVRKIYRRTHRWLHEMNPYFPLTVVKFDELRAALIADIRATWRWLLHHAIHAEGEVFLVVMKNEEGQLMCVSATSND